MDNHTKQTDPSVEYLLQMFSEEFLRNFALKTGLIKRQCKIDPVMFFWVLILGFGVDFLRSVRALERRYEVEANIKWSDGALYDRFKPGLVPFLRECAFGNRISGAAAISHTGREIERFQRHNNPGRHDYTVA